jgi:hypothetical protein
VEEISVFRLVLSLILVNGVGFALRYYGMDTWLIVAGFRFHLSFVLPMLILYPRGFIDSVIKNLLHPVYKRKFLPVFWIVIVPCIIMAALFLINKAELADPDNFYEFGLSSIIDYPVYLIWNLPQFLLLFLFLRYCTKNRKNKFFPSFLLIIVLFAYEFIPVDFVFDESLLASAADFLLAALCTAFLFHFYNNIYWFTATIFGALWFNLLAFGTKTTLLVNMLFAAQYKSWEGFFTVDPLLKQWLMAGELLLLLVFLVIFLPSRNYSASDEPVTESEEIKSSITA